MKVTKTQWTLEGSPEEIAAILPQLSDQLDQPPAIAAPEPAPTLDEDVDRPIIDFIKQVLVRRAAARGQEHLFAALYPAKDGLDYDELCETMKRSQRELAGLLGAFGNRIARTPGHDAIKSLTGNGGIDLLLEINRSTEPWHYRLRHETRKALEELGRIKSE